MADRPELISQVERAVRFGEELGANEVEAYTTSVDSKRIILTDKIESVHASYTSGIGIRVIIDKKTGFFASSSLSVTDVKRAVETAVRIARLSVPDKDWVSLPTRSGKKRARGCFDKKIVEITPSILTDGATQMIETVKENNKQREDNLIE